MLSKFAAGLFAVIALCMVSSAHAQLINTGSTDKLISALGTTIETLIFLALFFLTTMPFVFYGLARANGHNGVVAKRIGLSALFGAFLVMGFITAPFGVAVIVRALYKCYEGPIEG